MADTRVQLEVEDWVRDVWMQEQFACEFYRKRLSLISGGVFDFDAVSKDGKIAACISTSEGKTASGKHAAYRAHGARSGAGQGNAIAAQRRYAHLQTVC